MGKTSRKRRHDDRMKKKRAAKQARRALYASLAGSSRRRKSKIRATTAGVYKHAHIMANCGNPGCNRCYRFLVGLK